jgi:VanZ family protein
VSKSMRAPVSTKQALQRPKVRQRWLLVLIYASAIFVASALPGDNLPSLRVSDKLVHAAEFGILAFLLCRALRAHLPSHSRYFIMVVSILATIAYGASDEAHQWLVAGRTTEFADLAADSLGACLAAWGWVKAGTHWPWLQ